MDEFSIAEAMRNVSFVFFGVFSMNKCLLLFHFDCSDDLYRVDRPIRSVIRRIRGENKQASKHPSTIDLFVSFEF